MSFNSLNVNSALMAQQSSIPKIDKDAKNAEIRKQTDAFESLIIKMVMDNAAKDDKNLFSSQKDPGDKIYKSMYRDELSKASAGGFGFSQMLYDHLTQKS